MVEPKKIAKLRHDDDDVAHDAPTAVNNMAGLLAAQAMIHSSSNPPPSSGAAHASLDIPASAVKAQPLPRIEGGGVPPVVEAVGTASGRARISERPTAPPPVMSAPPRASSPAPTRPWVKGAIAAVVFVCVVAALLASR